MPGSFAPTAVRWGVDNRTCALRLVGHGPSLRVENRVPGGDVNPYLAVAAMIAAGLHGDRPRAAAGAGVRRQRLHRHRPAGAAHAARRARAVAASSELAREAFGNDVVEHYANDARVELAAFDAAVTDWELQPRLRADVSTASRERAAACPRSPC